ncbi:hypothetical protein KAI12_02780 [Candidatus Bathyarchaeota archaeon]|nr:hypothetical protein [Candidatus Bathyarchaeota archaeon]
MPKAKGKKLVSVSEDLIAEIAKVSRSGGESVSKFIEDTLRQTVEVRKRGYDLKQVMDCFNVIQAHRVLGGVFVPSPVLDYLTGKVYKENSERRQAKWYESGRWNGKYLKEKFQDPIEAFRYFLEISRWDLNEVEVDRSGGSLKFRCVSTVLTKAGTELLAKFIEGMLEGLGYRTEKVDCLKGMILLHSKR